MLAERFGFQPSELWEMEAWDIDFWLDQSESLNKRHGR